MDRTKDSETWNKGIKSQKLVSIADVCNRSILSNFLSLWGFSAFIHKFVYVDLDTVIQQYIKKCNLYIFDISKLYKIEHTHNDYIREFNNKYDMWLHNPDCKALPTIFCGWIPSRFNIQLY